MLYEVIELLKACIHLLRKSKIFWIYSFRKFLVSCSVCIFLVPYAPLMIWHDVLLHCSWYLMSYWNELGRRKRKKLKSVNALRMTLLICFVQQRCNVLCSNYEKHSLCNGWVSKGFFSIYLIIYFIAGNICIFKVGGLQTTVWQ